ncbi:MAG: T9SS type A sorting domain-containing protein [Bacteroidales bacterium]|jgi:hypothetical protein|nr:T9SS type A sorting domain-containing protein [Bacteroidales bacterium]
MKIRYILTVLACFARIVSTEGQIAGCPDRLAVNYNPSASINNGSCIYNPANIKPVATLELPSTVSETSGLILWNNYIWTHNDNTDTNIYGLDTVYGSISEAIALNGVSNTDWEEISQDENFIYIGDFGNNSGNRKDLRILRVGKNSLLAGLQKIDTIGFLYSDQTDFNPGDINKTDFDCEAFIVSHDSIYLFTKEWVSKGTTVYSLPKTPGNHVARRRSSLDTGGLITGSVFLEDLGIIVLSGYSKTLDPFLYLLYDFTENDFFGGNRRKVVVLLPSHQTEGITSSDGIRFYLSNERFSFQPLINVPQKIHVLNLSPFLGNYLGYPIPVQGDENNFIISPVPARDMVTVKSLPALLPSDFSLINLNGSIVMQGILDSEEALINISKLSPGTYILKIGMGKKNAFKVIKI